MVKLVDTLDSGSSVGNNMEVRVLSWAQSNELILSPGVPSDSGGFFLRPSAHLCFFVLWRTAIQIRFSAEQLKSALARGSFDFLFFYFDLNLN